MTWTKDQSQKFLEQYSNEKKFPSLVNLYSSGPLMALELRKEHAFGFAAQVYIYYTRNYTIVLIFS